MFMNKNQILKVYGKDYKAMAYALAREAGLASLIKKSDRIGIKPNLVSPTPAEFGATTHPEVVAGLVEYLKDEGFWDIVIIEGSWVGDKTSDAYEYCGYRDLCQRYEIPFIDAQQEPGVKRDCKGMDINICRAALDIDFMINVPVLKGHGQTKITCALKNMKGLIPNTEKRLFHKLGLHAPVGHLSTGLRQDFILVDHICGDLLLEDGGNPVVTDCLMAATDPVLVDAYGCALLGLDVAEVPYIGIAEELKVGQSDLASSNVTVYEFEKDTLIQCLSHSADVEDAYEAFRRPDDRLLDIKIAVEEVDSCSACHAALIPALMRIKEMGKLDALMEALGGKISIGQGYRGKGGHFGIGACCSGFEKNVEGCPADTEAIYGALMEILEQKGYT